jgi:HAD superfamily hydrolase (TIGR01490 family)
MLAKNRRIMRIAAFFDLDDTIIKGNSGLRSVARYFLTGRVSIHHAFKILYRYLLYWQGKSDPYRFFSNIYDFMRGRDIHKEKLTFSQYFDRNLKKRIYKEARQKIDWHKKRGHFVAIVTNSLDIMIGKIKDQLHIDHLIASSLEVRKGRITGKTAIVSFGKNKVRYIKELARKLNIDLKKSYAYSDNGSDIPLLSAVGHPVAINPQRKLRKFARQHNWQIMNFREIGG